MMIVAIAWIYVVGMMSIAESSIVAGIMTFLMYCVLPLTIILYVMDAPRRRQKINHAAAQQKIADTAATTETAAVEAAAPTSGSGNNSDGGA